MPTSLWRRQRGPCPRMLNRSSEHLQGTVVARSRGVANDARNLTPNPFPSGKGNRKSRGNRVVLSPSPPFRRGKGEQRQNGGAFLSFNSLTPGAGVTHAEGSREK